MKKSRTQLTISGSISLDGEDDYVLNRVCPCRDRRDFIIQSGDTGKPEDHPRHPAQDEAE